MTTNTPNMGAARAHAPRPAEPEALTVNQPTPGTIDQWTVSTGAATRDSVRVDVAAREINAPTGNTPEARALRGLATVRAALDPESLRDLTEHIREVTVLSKLPYHRAREIVEAANLWRVADHARHHTIADLDAIKSPDLPHRATARLMAGDGLGALVEYAAAQSCGESRRVAHAIGQAQPEYRETLAKLRAVVGRILDSHRNRWWDAHTRDYDLKTENGEHSQASIHAVVVTTEIVRAMLAATPQEQAAREFDDEAPKGTTTQLQPGTTLWQPLRLWRGELTKHTPGTLTRGNRRASANGRTFRFPDRLWTDPERRAFQRKARGNGATLVFDCSGSMRLDADDISAVLDAASGATVWAYQHLDNERPSLYLLAQEGARVAALPRDLIPGAGSNGVDAPALRHAAEHHNPADPFIWVSDTHYNGRARGTGDPYLATDLLDILTTTNAINVRTPAEAVTMLERMSRGGHPDPATIPATVAEYALPHWLTPRATWLPAPTRVGSKR